jgi:hypothetical protein
MRFVKGGSSHCCHRGRGGVFFDRRRLQIRAAWLQRVDLATPIGRNNLLTPPWLAKSPPLWPLFAAWFFREDVL